MHAEDLIAVGFKIRQWKREKMTDSSHAQFAICSEFELFIVSKTIF